VRSGLFNRRITIQKKSTTKNADYGTEVITWVTHATVWASVVDILPSKTESTPNNIRINSVRTKIIIRYLSTVTSDMRIKLTDRDDEILQIIGGPSEIGRRDGMEIMAETYSTAGA
jgi:SPP1 family predicted phage head-tail adaptor